MTDSVLLNFENSIIRDHIDHYVNYNEDVLRENLEQVVVHVRGEYEPEQERPFEVTRSYYTFENYSSFNSCYELGLVLYVECTTNNPEHQTPIRASVTFVWEPFARDYQFLRLENIHYSFV